MYLCTFSHPIDVSFAKSAAEVKMTLDPGVDYVLSASQYAWLSKADVSPSLNRVSHLESRLRNFVANPFGGRGESLVFYAGAGGYGDQLMAIPVAKLLADMGYEVTVIVDPGNQPCWYNLPFVKAVLTLPLPYATLKLFQRHALLQEVTNIDEHPDQAHPVDAMLHRIGIDPRTIDPAKKVVAPLISPEESSAAERFLDGRPVALYQLGGSGQNRRLSPAASRELLLRLAELVPELMWLGIYDHHIPGEYYAPLPSDAPSNVQLFTFPGLRQLFATAQRCVIGVSIDSLLVHLMGSFGKPVVGLWGPLAPDLRVRYYQRHVAVWNQSACQLSPCLRYKPTLEKCPQAAQVSGMCLCLKEVTAEQVAAAVRSALV